MAAISLAALVVALLASLTLLVSLARQGHRQAVVGPLRFVVVCVCLWITVNIVVAAAEPVRPAALAVWALPPAAAASAGAVAVAAALVRPRWRMSIRTWTLLSIHPTVMLLLAIVPSWSDLVFRDGEPGELTYGPFLYVHSAAVTVFITWGLVQVSRARRRLPTITGMSGSFVVLGWVAPLVCGVASATRAVPSGVDLTSAGIAVSAIVVWIGALRPGLLELQPIARDWVFDNLNDAVFVVGVDRSIVDYNERASSMMERRDAGFRTRHIALDELYPEFRGVLDEVGTEGGEVDISTADHELIVWVSATMIQRHAGMPLGMLVQVRDMTETALRQREAASMRLALEAEARVNADLRMELSEQVMRDPATGLHNRRFVAANVPAMMLRAVSEGTPFSLVMFDIDHFKQVNDVHGHTVGDRVIAAVAAALEDNAPPAASVVRFGGEEFLVVLPGMGQTEAFAAAEALRAACAGTVVPTRDGDIAVHLSAGVATATAAHETSDHLIDDADRALYQAKQNGRNRTVAWQADEDDPAHHSASVR